MPALFHMVGPLDLVHRLRRVLTAAQLDCQCRTTLDGVLDQFSNLEFRERLRESLHNAQRQRDWISSQLSFLADLDDISEFESDHTVFEELALLFEDIGIAAADAARAIREARPDSVPLTNSERTPTGGPCD